MFFMAKTSTSESKLKERLQRWGSQGRSGSSSGSNSPASVGSDQDTQTTSSSRNNSPTSLDSDKVKAPSKDTILYLGAFTKPSVDDNMSNQTLSTVPVFPPRSVTPEQKMSTFGIFLQGTKDGFTPLDCIGDWKDSHEEEDDNPSVNQLDPSSPIITNSSILAVRYNANQSRSMRDHKFQWYRSTLPVETPKVHNHSYWKSIYGATRAVYQPSVTDCGYQLKCVIIVEEPSDDESEHHPTNRTSSSHECILCHGIELDPDILSQAQTCFDSHNSASFDHLLGCGKAEGKIFRLVMEQGYAKYRTDMDPNNVSSNVTIYQVSGNSEIALHDVLTPIFHVTAEADASRPNIFYLVLPIDMPDSASAIQSLSINRRLEFYAEDRVIREICMTALGIANFNGNPSNLSVKTPLFQSSDVPDEPPISTPARVSPTLRPVSIQAVSLFIGQVGTSSEQVVSNNTTVQENMPAPSPPSDRQPPSPYRPAVDRSSSFIMNHEALELKVRVDALERSLKQKDCDLVQSETTIESERKKCEELREALNTAEQRIDFMYEDRIQMRKDLLGQISSLELSLATSQELLNDRNRLMASLESRNSLLSATIESKNQEINELSSLKRRIVEFSHVISERDNLQTRLQDSNTSKEFISLLQSRLHESETRLEQTNASLLQVEEQKRLNQDLQQIVSDLQSRIVNLEESLRQKDDHIQANEFALEVGKLQNQQLESALHNARNEIDVLRNEEIVKRDDLILRLSTLEKDVETYAETVQGYEKLILSLEEEKSTLLASMGDREDDIKNIFELKRQLDEFSSIAEERDTLKAEIDRLRSNGESVSDLQGRLLEAENTIQELDSIFIQFHEEQKKNKEYQAAISDLMNRLQDLEKELIVKNEQILSQEMRLDGEKSRSQEMEYSPSRSRKKSGFEGELANRARDVLAERVSKLEAELQSKVSTLHSYEVLITSMQNELVTASVQKEKALLQVTGSPLTPRSMKAALERGEPGTKTALETPKKDEAYSKLLHDRDSIRNALSIITKELVINQDSLMQKEESCGKLNMVINELNLALINANEKLQTAENEKERLQAQFRALEIQRNSVQVVCGCFPKRR